MWKSSTAYVPEENGFTERSNGSVTERLRTMLHAAQPPESKILDVVLAGRCDV